MSFRSVFLVCSVTLIIVALIISPADAASPKGAKALFDSGEGPALGVSVKPSPGTSGDAPARKEKYTGISYQLMLVGEDGQFKVVPKTRVFKSGEKLKMLVRTNRPGYMTILNIGPTGNTNVLFNEYIDAFSFVDIPKGSNMVFTGAPGTEKLLVMLSDNPNPLGGQTPPGGAVTAGGPGSYSTGSGPAAPAPPTDSYAGGTGYLPATGDAGYAPQPSYPATGGYAPPPADTMAPAGQLPPPPPAAMIASNIEGAKGIRGSKDIVVEDGMKNSFTVISPKAGYKPVRTGTKDIVLESSGGTNYGVIPASAAAGGGILTLEVRLSHR